MKLSFVLLSSIAIATCRAQVTGACGAEYDKKLSEIKQARSDAELSAALDRLVPINRNAHCFAEFAAQHSLFKSLVHAFENSRTDKQTGASAGSSGGTSLVSRGTAAKALGVAAEYGALTQSVKAQVVTISGNLAGVPSVLAKNDVLPYCDPRTGPDKGCIRSDTLRFLRRISFGFSFDTSRDSQTVTGTATGTSSPSSSGSTAAAPSNATPVNFRANGAELSQITGRFEVVNRRDTISKTYQDAWKAKMNDEKDLAAAGQALLKELDDTIGDLTELPVYKTWFKVAVQRLTAVQKGGGDLKAEWTNLLSDLVRQMRVVNPDFDQRVARLQAAFQKFDITEDEFIDRVSTKPLVTFEYVNSRPVGQSTMSTFRLIGEAGWGKNNLTFNGAATIYDEQQPPLNGLATSRWRDWQVGVQYERKLGHLSLLGPAALDGTFYYQNQRSPAVLDVDPKQPLPGITFVGLSDSAKKVFAEKGNIGIGQVKLVLGPGGSNVKVPLAVSWSNRTELINRPAWRAQVGITYDFDSVFSK